SLTAVAMPRSARHWLGWRGAWKTLDTTEQQPQPMKEWEVEEVSGNHPGTPVTIDAEEREESSSGPTDAADADDRTEFARLEALATVEEQENARRWAFMAGLGLLVTAVSTVWWWWVTPA